MEDDTTRENKTTRGGPAGTRTQTEETSTGQTGMEAKGSKKGDDETATGEGVVEQWKHSVTIEE